ncbi:hypothetical protein AAF712_015588 [Marasmius tenuissimus]|uniref:Saccharopine dehydrogenase n=1 Tax=Marasmius tenuissimus TaxID=585030 RepID=A0ABR2Z8X9_9AGAR
MNTEGKQTKNIILLGSGYVARLCAEYLVRNPANEVTIALSESLPHTTPISLDVSNAAELERQVATHDLVISLIPYTYRADVIKAVIKGKTDSVVMTSSISSAMRELHPAAKEAGIIVLNEIGLDPGIDHLYAVKTIDEVHEQGEKIKKFFTYCSGLPSPQHASKFQPPRLQILLVILSQTVSVSGDKLMGEAKPYYISPAYAFVAYPNRDSTPFRKWYNINREGEGETVVRGTLRYQGFPEFIKALVDLGWLDATEKDWLVSDLIWKQIVAIAKFPDESEKTRIISGLRWIGFFSDEKIIPRAAENAKHANLLDTLCVRLELLMKCDDGERDFVMLQHKFVVSWPDGREEVRTSTLEAYGAPFGSGYSAMAQTVGVPCGIATQLVLDGAWKGKVLGVTTPYTKEICDPIRERLEKEGLGMVERIL